MVRIYTLIKDCGEMYLKQGEQSRDAFLEDDEVTPDAAHEMADRIGRYTVGNKIFQEEEADLWDEAAHREPHKFEMYSTDDGPRLRFAFESGTYSNEKPRELLEMVDGRIEDAYETTGAWLLLIGFSLQLVAQAVSIVV